MTKSNALLGIMGLVMVWMVYRFNRQEGNTYNVVDMLVGPDGKASTTNHILIAMVLLSVWVTVDRELRGKDDVSTILLGVLGIFVLKQTATGVTEILNKPATTEVTKIDEVKKDTPEGTNVQTKATKTTTRNR